jgi:hypothetical protein
MALSYLELYARLSDANGPLLQRTAWALFHSLRFIQIEAAGTANHAARKAFADAVLADASLAKLKAKSLLVLQDVMDNGTIAANPDRALDNDIQFVVDTVLGDPNKLTALGT